MIGINNALQIDDRQIHGGLGTYDTGWTEWKWRILGYVLFFEIDEKVTIGKLKSMLKPIANKRSVDFHIAETRKGYHIISLALKWPKSEWKEIFRDLQRMGMVTDYVFEHTNYLRISPKYEKDDRPEYKLSIWPESYDERISYMHYQMFKQNWKNTDDFIIKYEGLIYKYYPSFIETVYYESGKNHPMIVLDQADTGDMQYLNWVLT